MPTRLYRIADTIVQIETGYNYTHRMCQDYLYSGSDLPELVIHPTLEQIEREREIYIRTQTEDGHPDAYSGDNLIEFTVVHSLLSEYVLRKGFLLMHGSAIAVDGEAYLFTARSGTGKSTHTALWMEHFGDRAVMVNGDKPYLKVSLGVVTVYGSPWNGKEHLGSNTTAPLKAICVLERDSTNHIERMDSTAASSILIQQTFRPEGDVMGTVQSLTLLSELTQSVPIYLLGCNMDPEAALVAYNGMQGPKRV